MSLDVYHLMPNTHHALTSMAAILRPLSSRSRRFVFGLIARCAWLILAHRQTRQEDAAAGEHGAHHIGNQAAFDQEQCGNQEHDPWHLWQPPGEEVTLHAAESRHTPMDAVTNARAISSHVPSAKSAGL
jgi:hypothetical protein